jgi:hypothetical protein
LLYDKRQSNIDELRHLLFNFNWSNVYNCIDIQLKYDTFLMSLKNMISTAIPCKTVTMGPRDPPFMTPLVKDLLNTRRKLLRRGCLVEANSLALRINDIIANIRSQTFAKLTNATSKQLWDAVKPKANRQR